MTNQPTNTQRHVGFVELPDGALDVLTYYAQRSEWNVSIVVGVDPQSYAVRMAGVLRVPVLEAPDRLSLVQCSRIIVGNKPASLVTRIRELLEDTAIEVVSLDEAMGELGLRTGKGAVSDMEGLVVDNRTAFFGGGNRVEDGDGDYPEAASPEMSRAETPPFLQDGFQPGAAPINAPSSEEGEIAKETPEPDPPSADAPDSNRPSAITDSQTFDIGLLLGEDFREKLGALPLDANGDHVLREILELAVKVVHAHSGSIMLLDESGTHLRIAVADGLPTWVVTHTRQRVGKGIAGEVFSSGKPRIVDGKISKKISGSADVRPGLRQAACVPIPSKNGPIGVMNVNTEADGVTLDAGKVRLLSLFAREASAAVIKAIDLKRLNRSMQKEALLRQIERLMSLEELRSARLSQIGDALSQSLEPALTHFYGVSEDGAHLILVSPARGMAGVKSQPMNAGFLGWLLACGEVQVMEATGNAIAEPMAMAFIPIVAGMPYGVLVLEKVPLKKSSSIELLKFLTEVKEVVEAQLALEEATELLEDDLDMDLDSLPESA